MVRILGLGRGELSQPPREISLPSSLMKESGESGWLIRFFDSSFFCEWIAVSYLYKHDHPGVRDYLCNRMYTLQLSGIESYLFQICYMLIHKPSPSLDKFVTDMCSKSLLIALKVHWLLLAEIEDTDDTDGVSRIQEKCQIAATLMGEWPLLVNQLNESLSPGSKNQVLNKILSSKQKLLSMSFASSSPVAKSSSFSHSSTGSLDEDGNEPPSEDGNIFKKLIPGPKMRDALLFRRSMEKEEEVGEKDGFFRRLLKDSGRVDDEELASSSEGFFKRFMRDSVKGENDDVASSSDGFFKRLLRDNSKVEEDEVSSNSDGFFKRLFRDAKGNDGDEKMASKPSEDDEKEGFFKKFFKDKLVDRNDGNDRNDGESNPERKCSRPSEDEEKEGFFRKLFKDRFDDKKDTSGKPCEGNADGVEETFDFSFFRRFFRVHPEDVSGVSVNEDGSCLAESSPGTEKFFRKLFRDRDHSIEESELYGLKKNKEKLVSSFKHQNEKNAKPQAPTYTSSQLRKSAFHESLDFVLSLCETSYGLVDVFPVEDRKSALRESLMEINLHLGEVQNSGGVCFPMGNGTLRVMHILEDEAILLNSREKAPFMICIEVLKCEIPRGPSGSQKLSRGGIPLANGDAFLPQPPPWACPLQTVQEVYRHSRERMSRSTAEAIDQAMSHTPEAKSVYVNVTLSVENGMPEKLVSTEVPNSTHGIKSSVPDSTGEHADLEWVRVVMKADSGARGDDVGSQGSSGRKEHRRVPSTIAIEEAKAAAAKGEAPAGLPLKRAGQDSSDAEPWVDGGISRACDALSGELWEAKKERIRKASDFGKFSGWDLRSIIVKSGDDCRQEHLAVQLISHFYDIFQEAGLPLWLRPYEVLVTSSYTALIETITDTASLHSIKSRYPNIMSLREFFVAKYEDDSSSFKLAQRNFVESMAGYSLVSYLLQVKDRHNGNLLLDEEGHIIHIDFGFMLSNSPGGVNFESAPFKLTRELLEVMDSDADGAPSEYFDYFKVLCIQGFLTCRKHAERIILLVEMLQDSGFPCFKGGPRTIQNLRKRFHLSLTEEQCVSLVLSLISSSLDAWRTRQYDYYQRVLNGIL